MSQAPDQFPGATARHLTQAGANRKNEEGDEGRDVPGCTWMADLTQGSSVLQTGPATSDCPQPAKMVVFVYIITPKRVGLAPSIKVNTAWFMKRVVLLDK